MANLMVRGIPDDLYAALKRSAEMNHRSLNGEVLTRLDASVRQRPADPETIIARAAVRARENRVPDLDPAALAAMKDEGRP